MVGLTRHRLFAYTGFVSLGFLGCGATPADPVVSSAPAASARPVPPAPPSAAPAPPTPPRKTQPDAAGIYARLERDLGACYLSGRKTTPEMLDAKLTLNASIDATGMPTCVIPSQNTGLTQDVEDCMSARFAKEKFDDGTPWSASVPVVIRGGTMTLGQRGPDAISFESIETIRMPDAFDVLESLQPELQACVRRAEKGSGLRGLLVAARVGPDGRPQCALATSAGVLAPQVGDCAAGVLRAAKFPPPKRGSGLVLVPIIVLGAK